MFASGLHRLLWHSPSEQLRRVPALHPAVQERRKRLQFIGRDWNEKLQGGRLELPIWFEGNRSNHAELIKLSDDILVRCKHFENNKTRVAMFRLMFNCAFVFDNVYRVWERELDKSYLFKVQKDFFIDFIFERGNQKSFQTADRPQ